MSYDCIVLGAGLAGTSVAWHLSRCATDLRILILERENAAGTHASAQNAAMIRALVGEDELVPFATAGTRFWNQLPDELNWPGVFNKTGSLLLASEESTLELLKRRVAEAADHGLHAEIWSPQKCRAVFPALAETPFLAAAYCADDGVGDPQALIDGFLAAARQRGVEYRRKTEVHSLHCENGRIAGVKLASGETLRADRVVLAAGAWSPALMQKAGVEDRGLQPHRRHLFVTGPAAQHVEGLCKQTPIVWHLDLQVYLRWETGGLLFSACDEDAYPACRPDVDNDIETFVEERVGKAFPFLLDLPLSNSWAGLRTFTPNHEFVLGAEAELPGLYYATGLGGHGVTCAAPAGGRVAQEIFADMQEKTLGSAKAPECSCCHPQHL